MPPADPTRPDTPWYRQGNPRARLRPQPASQLHRQLPKEAPLQGVIDFSVGHGHDVRPDWKTANRKPELGNRDGRFSVMLRGRTVVCAPLAVRQAECPAILSAWSDGADVIWALTEPWTPSLFRDATRTPARPTPAHLPRLLTWRAFA